MTDQTPAEDGQHERPTQDLASTRTRVLASPSEDTSAREHAERAVTIFEATQAQPGYLAKLRFVLARALWSDPTQRARARTLAGQARDELAGMGQAKRESTAELDAWLTDHPAP